MRCDAIGGAERHRPFDSNSPFVSRPNYAVLSSLLAALLFAASGAAQARIINAASPSLTDVKRAIASAVHGDTVIVPAGTAAWTSCLTITKGITIQGQTTTNSDNGTASDQTILIDNLVRVAGGQGYFHCSTSTADQLLRITGITFSGQGGIQTIMPNGAIRLHGNPNMPVRIDHCHFMHLNHSPMVAVYGAIFGVSDHNVFDDFVAQDFSHEINGYGYGDEAWSERAGFGGPKFFFMEDNYIYLPSYGNGGGGGVNAFFGGKYVFRYNHVWNATTLGHSTASSWLRGRGVRAQEIYNNDWHFSNPGALDGTTGGSLIAHDNTFDGTLITGWHLQVYRAFWSYGAPFYGADGSNVWDVNDPQLYESGTLTSANNINFTITDSTKNWVENQWAGYSVVRPSNRMMALITGNTNNTLNLLAWQTLNWATGNGYQIHKVLIVLDQPGRGKGDLISGDPPTPVGWPHQEQEPCYSWNNIHNPGGEHLNFVLGGGANTINENDDFYNDTPMPGYMPYTYPHPLVVGEPFPTPTPTAIPSPIPTVTPTATATATPTATPTPTATTTPTTTPTPNQCEVPNFIGVKTHHAQRIWNDAGFTTEVIILPGPYNQIDHYDYITWQSLPEGFIGSCSDTTIIVE